MLVTTRTYTQVPTPIAAPAPVATVYRMCAECEQSEQDRQAQGGAVMRSLARSHNLASVATVPAHRPIPQPSLRVSRPGDAFEREADSIADQVMRTTVPGERSTALGTCGPRISKNVQRQGMVKDDEEELQATLRTHDGPASVSADTVTRMGSGAPLEDADRQFMEQRFGSDFSEVRVHSGLEAQTAAAAVNARAYTLGSDIAFAPGQYAPGTQQGRRLLAHELTHVIQQGATVQRDFAVPQPHPEAEPAELTDEQVDDAIKYDRIFFTNESEIEQLRDVLGVSPTPAVVDEDMVRAIGRYQAQQGIDQDGKLGPITATRLSTEFRAEAAFLGREGRELRRESRRLDMRSFTITVTQAPREITTTGAAEFGVQWSVPDPHANGWVIQHVTFASHKEDCAGNDVATNTDDGLEYWEGWEVRNGHVFIGATANAHHADTFRTVDEGAGTSGTSTITGRVTFMPNYDLQEPPWGHTVPAAGDLPTVTAAPDGWSDGFARLHQMTVRWDDCVAPATHSVRGRP